VGLHYSLFCAFLKNASLQINHLRKKIFLEQVESAKSG
jgi:hypothetical protein